MKVKEEGFHEDQCNFYKSRQKESKYPEVFLEYFLKDINRYFYFLGSPQQFCVVGKGRVEAGLG